MRWGKSVDRRKRLSHKKAGCAPGWDRRFRLSTRRTRRFFHDVLWSGILLATVLAFGLLAAQGPVKITVNTQLVVETVSVTDKSGKPVEGLTAKDFVVAEDGVVQTVSFCEYQKMQDAAPVVAAAPPHRRRRQTRLRRSRGGRSRPSVPEMSATRTGACWRCTST